MISKIFVDTNILIYSLDQFDPVKQKKSRELLETLTENFQGVISTQVLQEFYVTAVNKLGADPLLIKDILYAYEWFEIVIITPDRIKEAIDCSIINRLSFWDALIVVAAESANCERLWSEDLNDGQVIRGVRIENPL
ncbi:toxin-antitoxin system, toxin component, PIN family [delta proteobacterium NaphS2]|nr:toxin-antitoxin system, toxin component, PIN family [delta proteobacterium NaphS2]